MSHSRFFAFLVGPLVGAALLTGCLNTIGTKAKPARRAPAAAAAAKPMETMTKPPAGWNDPPVDGSPGVETPASTGHNLLANGTFDDGKFIPWATSFSAPAAGRGFVMDRELCTEVTEAGNNNWDAQFRVRDMVIQKGHTYAVRFKIHATKTTRARIKVGQAGPPYIEYWMGGPQIGPQPKIIRGAFRMAYDDDPTAELAFHIGGPQAEGVETPFTVCVDDVEIDDPEFAGRGAEKSEPLANLLINQVGYLPNLSKMAVVRDAASAPLDWQLLDGAHKVVASGKTQVHGPDDASGDNVHVIDFSSVKTPGTYVLRAGASESLRFVIAADVYRRLKYDALAYFFHNRSGIEIAMPYAEQKKWARPAGHLSDNKVPCAPKSGCDYTLDVSGGWYDAGDHGKYVVNGGISAWTMLNQWERGAYLGKSNVDFGDGHLQIPENRNQVPDLLDEARWEVEFLLKMQVPDGQPLAGMVHHKIHDEKWTGLGTAPDQDPMKRLLFAPSTAATLNMAAVAAQASRIWQKVDPAFSKKCLEAARKAYAAAKKNPKVLAAGTTEGGGPYSDGKLDDEFYWAAAELFITTGEDAFKGDMMSSRWWKEVSTHEAGPAGPMTSMTWGWTASLGSLSLAVVPNRLPKSEVDQIRANVKKAADAYIQALNSEGYRVPFTASRYPWGSNSFVLNNLLVMGLAGDFSKDPKYADAVAVGMDYILGRNPLDQSFVTGYGTRPLRNPHHRFWAHQANRQFPEPPPGAVSGGPNSGLEDPQARGAGLEGCAPQKCFVDHIESWSTNEITINWNAPLAWVAAYLDEVGNPTAIGTPPPAPRAAAPDKKADNAKKAEKKPAKKTGKRKTK